MSAAAQVVLQTADTCRRATYSFNMPAPPIPADESQRLEALLNLGLPDTSTEPQFDRITRLACCVAKAPIALICFVDEHRQWFMSRQGVDATETTRENSFCSYAILREEPLIVADALEDSRFANNPLVLGSPFGRFYAGHPIHAPGGERVGTLCVMDTQPRSLTLQELGGLADLAALVDAEILAVKFASATRTVGVGVHERRGSDRSMWWSDAMWDILGQDARTFSPSADNWLAMIHPEDQDFVKASGGAWGKSRTSLSIQYRIIRPDGMIRHLQSIASKTDDDHGSIKRIAGITLDVTERVTAEQRAHWQQQDLRDSSHRAGMAEIAANVIHNVGNVVNSLGIANSTIRLGLKALRLERLGQATALIRANRAHLAAFFTDDEHGRHLPDYLPALSAQIASNVQAVLAELQTSDALLEHLRDIVSAQQVCADVGGLREPLDLKELLDSTLIGQTLEMSAIEVVRRYETLPPVLTDRHKLLRIIVNLLDNARDSVSASVTRPRRIVVRLYLDEDHVVVGIEDSGVGMSPEVLSHLWRFGFTTKPNGQGFDLQQCQCRSRAGRYDYCPQRWTG